MMICGSLVGGFGADGDAEGDLLQEAEVDLAKVAAAIVPVDDLDFVRLVRDAADLIEDDEMRREAAFEFVMVLLVQIGVIDIQISEAGLHALFQVGKEVGYPGSEKVGAGGLDMVAQHFVDDAVEFTVVHGGPEGIFGAGVEAAEKKVEVA